MKTGYTVVIWFGTQYYFQKPSQLSGITVAPLIPLKGLSLELKTMQHTCTIIFVPLVQKSLMKIDIGYDNRAFHLINFVFINFVYKDIGPTKQNHYRWAQLHVNQCKLSDMMKKFNSVSWICYQWVFITCIMDMRGTDEAHSSLQLI